MEALSDGGSASVGRSSKHVPGVSPISHGRFSASFVRNVSELEEDTDKGELLECRSLLEIVFVV